MNKLPFQDLMRKKAPTKIWRFFVLSFFFHITMGAILLTLPLGKGGAPIPHNKDSRENNPHLLASSETMGENETNSAIPLERAPAPENDPYMPDSDTLYHGSNDYGNDDESTPESSNKKSSAATPTGEPGTQGFREQDVVDLTKLKDGKLPGQPVKPAVKRTSNTNRPGGSGTLRTTDPKQAGGSGMRYTYSSSMNKVPDLIETDDIIKLYRKPFQSPLHNRPSSYRVDVGTLSYPRVRRELKHNQLPSSDIVKIEEMINYFSYDYPQPEGNKPFSVTTEINACPWAPNHLLLQIGLQGKKVFKDAVKNSMYYIAKDVKVNVKFDPKTVKGYRLIGYANRRPKTVKRGDLGELSGNLSAGESLTTLYEIIPAALSKEEENREQIPIANIDIRYKVPRQVTFTKISQEVRMKPNKQKTPSENFRFSSAVAQFSMLLKNPETKTDDLLDTLTKQASEAKGSDPHGHRTQFLDLIEQFRKVAKKK